jgi:hypothetical protein
MGPRRRHGWGPLRAGTVLLVVLGLLGLLFPAAPARPAPWRPVHSITLPDAAPVLPDGPNRELFQAHCELCHSSRLVLTQPRMSEKQWGAIVHKMITTYGAPTYGASPTPDQQRVFEQAIVAYLMSVRGTGP